IMIAMQAMMTGQSEGDLKRCRSLLQPGVRFLFVGPLRPEMAKEKGREFPPALASDRCAGPQPRCIHTDLIWVTAVSVSSHWARPMPDCLKPPQIEVMWPWSKQLTQTMPASMSRAALCAVETSEVQIEAARP